MRQKQPLFSETVNFYRKSIKTILPFPKEHSILHIIDNTFRSRFSPGKPAFLYNMTIIFNPLMLLKSTVFSKTTGLLYTKSFAIISWLRKFFCIYCIPEHIRRKSPAYVSPEVPQYNPHNRIPQNRTCIPESPTGGYFSRMCAQKEHSSALRGLSTFCTKTLLNCSTHCASCTTIYHFSTIKTLNFAFFCAQVIKKTPVFFLVNRLFLLALQFFACKIANACV